MTTYTNINKPSSTSYTNINLVGNEQFDDPNVLFDDPNVFFDGVNQSQYTKVQNTFKGLWNIWTYPWLLDLPWQVTSTSYTNVTKPI